MTQFTPREEFIIVLVITLKIIHEKHHTSKAMIEAINDSSY